MKDVSIKRKIIGLIVVVIVIITGILAVESVVTIKSVSEADIQSYKRLAYAEKENELKNYVSVAMYSVKSFYDRTSKEKLKHETQE